MNHTKFLGLLSVVALLLCGTASAQTITSAKGNIVVTKQVTGELAVSWTESGLVPNEWVSYLINGNVTATYACSTGSAATAMAPVGGPLSEPIALISSSSGTVRKTVGVNVPDAGSLASVCSGSLLLYQVSYTGMNICDATNNLLPCTTVGSGNFTQTFCNLKKNLGSCPPAS
jgi:hypothetical protein